MEIKEHRILDIAAPEGVEIKIRSDGETIWVNVDNFCVLRICRILDGTLGVNDCRTEDDHPKS